MLTATNNIQHTIYVLLKQIEHEELIRQEDKFLEQRFLEINHNMINPCKREIDLLERKRKIISYVEIFRNNNQNKFVDKLKLVDKSLYIINKIHRKIIKCLNENGEIYETLGQK